MECAAQAEQLFIIFLNGRHLEFQRTGQRYGQGIGFKYKGLGFTVKDQVTVFLDNEILFFAGGFAVDIYFPAFAGFYALDAEGRIIGDVDGIGVKGVFDGLRQGGLEIVRVEILRQFTTDAVVLNGKQLITPDALKKNYFRFCLIGSINLQKGRGVSFDTNLTQFFQVDVHLQNTPELDLDGAEDGWGIGRGSPHGQDKTAGRRPDITQPDEFQCGADIQLEPGRWDII